MSSTKKRCPNGLTCPVINVLKHNNLFYHDNINDDSNPGFSNISNNNNNNINIHTSSSPISEAADAPGLNTSGVKLNRNCPKGINCTLRNITKHEELFDHIEEVEINEAGAGTSISSNFMEIEDDNAPGM